MERASGIKWGLLALGIAAGVAVGLLLAPEAPQRWKRKARAGMARGKEAAGVVRDALEVFQEFRNLGRPLEQDVVEVATSWDGGDGIR